MPGCMRKLYTDGVKMRVGFLNFTDLQRLFLFLSEVICEESDFFDKRNNLADIIQSINPF